jgi:hypothetical protein
MERIGDIVVVDSNIGNEIKNISKPNDRGNINFDIQIHGEWFRILDCPPDKTTKAKKRAYVQATRLENARETIFNKENPINLPENASKDEIDIIMNLRDERLKDFKKRGIKAW